jgi:hypothetical protein
MPARRKSVHELTISGALRRNPGIYTSRAECEPRGADMPLTAPAHLAADLRATWLELRASFAENVLQAADVGVFELYVRLVHTMRHDGANFGSARMAALSRAAAQLGASPADRGRVRVALAPTATVEAAEAPTRRPSSYFTGQAVPRQ